MSRTYRNTSNLNSAATRTPRHARTLRLSIAHLEELAEAGYKPSNRHLATNSRVVTAFDDLVVAGLIESYTA